MFCLVLFVSFFNRQLYSQHIYGYDNRGIGEAGLPFTTHYPTDEYKAHKQNWTISQDKNGLMYFGNGDGVLIYDGTTWELITLPNQSSVLALTLDKSGRMYVGAVGEIGYLEADTVGRLTYISLLSFLKKEDQNFSRVYSVHSTLEGIYFQTPEAVFKWTGKKFKVWKAGGNRFTKSFWVNNILLLKADEGGLFQLKNEELKLLPNSKYFSDKTVSTIFPYDERRLLIGTLSRGLFLFDGQSAEPFNSELNNLMKVNKIYCGIQLYDSSFAFGTLQGGLFIIDKTGKRRLTFNSETKITSPIIFNLFQDKSGIIWAALNDGIAKIEYPSPFSEFGSNTELKGTVEAVIRYNNKIYAGTDRGLFYLDNSKSEQPVFRLVKGANQRIWSLLLFENSLLIGSDVGIYLLKGNDLTLISNFKTYTILRSKLDPNRIFIGNTDGLRSIYFKNSRWENEGKIPGVYGTIHEILETKSGILWLETNVNWMWKVSFKPDIKNPEVEKCGILKGLPDDVGHLYLFEDQLLFVCIIHNHDIYRYDQSADTFTIDTTINKILSINGQEIWLRTIDNFGNVWFDLKENENVKAKMVAWKESSEKYIVEDLKEARIYNYIGKKFLYENENNAVWFATKNGLIKHDFLIKEKEDVNFTTFVRKVIYMNDSILFAGIKPQSKRLFLPSLPFNNNKFRFQYSSLSFHSEKDNQYQYYLEGFDKDWSDWSNETQRNYTNLSEGNYIFHVRGKDIYGNVSREDQYAFIILPPWQRTWWAYLFYGLGMVGAVILIVQLRSKRLKREKEILENIVKERTHQLARQAERLEDQTQQLEGQAEKLREMDQQKSRFFANISHEFRTPLTLIKGPVDQSLEAPGESISKEDKVMIQNNTNRLLRLVNQLLDLSKIDAHSLELNLVKGDIFEFLRTIGSAFNSHADQRKINYNVLIPEHKLLTMFDHDKLEKIIYNILSNAFKFTPDKGKITLRSFLSKQSGKNGTLIIEIKDDGIGISKEQQKFIYDRFYQSDNSLTREHEGSGIGLALTKELLTLMNGNIKVESEPGKGTGFTIELPIQILPDFFNESKNIIHRDVSKSSYKPDGISNMQVNPEEVDEGSNDVPIVLIVEDNRDMRSFIKKQLINDYRILESPNGKEGLETAKREIPDLVITDLMMPQMDGMILCKKLKTNENTNHIPVIMLTAKAGQDQKIEGLETGADSYLTKPFDRKELQVLVKNLITQRRQLREKYGRAILLEPKLIPVSALDEQFLQKVMKYLEDNLSDAEFGVPEMQDKLPMSKNQLHRKMKAITNEAPGEFMRNYRLKRAAQILAQKGESVTQVAYSVGFNNLSYFAKCFKELHGIAPSEYYEKSKE
jgi:signal transduction histidine kinase/DNA-binding response OmpR family regulator